MKKMPAAFKHGISEADIRHTLKTFVYEDPLEEPMARMTDD
jgi:hypothetical protein